MTESKQSVAGQQPDNPQKGTRKQANTSSSTRKPAAPKAQAKSTPAKSPDKTVASPSRTGGSVSTLKANATRAEALEHENMAVQNKRASHSQVDTSDVSGVIVPSDQEERNTIEQERPMSQVEEEKQVHKKEHKHHSKDKKEHFISDKLDQGEAKAKDTVDPKKQLEKLQKKALKSENKVKKLKKKVHKAEKKEVKTSKLRALKEKLTKAFSKWQRRKKKVETIQG